MNWNKLIKKIGGLFLVIAMLLPMILQVIPVRATASPQTIIPIVLPAQATAVEQTAAQELQYYFKKMTGNEHPIVTEGTQSEGSIYVGATQAATAAGVTFEDNDLGEGWAIKAQNGNLYLAGGKTRGVLYAVYHLLEDVFGVRWWNMWEEYVPQYDTITIPDGYDRSGVPAIGYRDIAANVWEGTEFYARNRVNGWYTHTPNSYGGVEGFGGPWFIHTHNLYFPADTYLAEHPEWFAAVDKEESSRTGDQLCLSNDELFAAFVQKLLAQIASDYKTADENGSPRPVYFDVSPSDNDGHCQCSKCQTSRKISGASGHVLKFANKLAAEVAKVYPEVKLTVLAYAGYIEPPIDNTEPANNVVVWFAYIQMDILHSLNHKNNADFQTHIDTWLKLCGADQLYVWDYGINRGGIFPTAYKYGENFEVLNTLGSDGYFLELQNCINTDFWDMKLWLTAKLMEDPTQDYQALMDDFIYGYYGAAGKYVKAYLDLLYARAENSSGSYPYSCSTTFVEWLTLEDVLQADDYFEKAFAAAKNDDVVLRRLRTARKCLDQLIVDNYKTWKVEAAKAGIQLPFTEELVGARLAKTIQELIWQRGSYDSTGEALFAKYEKYMVQETKPLPAPLPSFTAGKLPSELLSIDAAHIYDYGVDTFSCWAGQIQEDADSLLGKAIVFAFRIKSFFILFTSQ